MKSIKEKQLLVKWSKAMNEPIDDTLVEEVERYEQLQKDIIESVRNNSIKDLVEASVVAEKLVEKVNEFPKPPTLDEMLEVLKEEQNELVQAQTNEETPAPSSEPPSLATRAAEHISKEVKLEQATFQQPNPPLVDKNLQAIQTKLKFLEQAIGKIAAHGPGSGSYWLYDLGDTNYDIIKNPSNNDVLTYNSSNTKWEVSNVTNLLGTRYHGSYYDMTTQTANVSGQPYFITLNTIDFQDGFTTDGANLIATYAGTYNLQFSAQLHRTGGGGSGDLVEFWLNKDGIDQANTGGITHIGPNNPYAVVSWNYLVPMTAGSKVALRWGTLNTNIILETSNTGIGPAVPSMIVTITSV